MQKAENPEIILNMLASSLRPLRSSGLDSTNLVNSACVFATNGDDRYMSRSKGLLLYVRKRKRERACDCAKREASTGVASGKIDRSLVDLLRL
ncbi:hypothetical protein LTR66_006947 [Elasticomyces elasticus]|nr:hypothetical protein LTR66_006947 [Elasticomyces elasticus]